MNNEVVDLLDDSDDEEPRKMQEDKTCMSQNATGAGSPYGSCIDLCSDSDDGAPPPDMQTPVILNRSSSAQRMSTSATVTVSTQKLRSSDAVKTSKISPVRYRYNTNNNMDDSDDDIPTESIFAKKTPSPAALQRASSLTEKTRQTQRLSLSCSSKTTTRIPFCSQPETISIDLSDNDEERIPMAHKSVGSTASTDCARKHIRNPNKKTSGAKKLLDAGDKMPGSSTTNKKSPSLMSTIPAIENPSNADSDTDLKIMPPGPAFVSKPTASTGNNKQNPYEALRLKATPKPAPTIRSTLAPSHSSPFQYPTLLTNSRQYEDLRAKLIWAFWKAARNLTLRAHERARLDQLGKKVVRLALSRHAIRSLDEFFLSFGKASVTLAAHQKEDIQRQLDAGDYGNTETPRTRYGQGFYTIVEACLVVLYEHVQRQIKDDTTELSEILKEKESWLSLEAIIPLIDARLRPECPARLTRYGDGNDCGAAYYLESSTRSVEFLQIAKLECELGDECGPRIKRHRRQGKVYFELLEVGYVDAEYIRGRSFPFGKGHYRTSQISGKGKAEFEGICLGVDRQEGGGAGKALHEMCGKLDMCKVPYFVGTLAIGDYVFFTSGENKKLDYLCPIIVERKSMQDVAMSIHDGRWAAQKSRMYKGQYIFGYNKCKMVYVLEGNENRQLVTGGYIGNRRYNVDKERLQEELDNLKLEGFEVIRTPSRESTMFELARWAKNIAKNMREGTLQAEYTYQQFKDELKEIPPNTDFSRMAKYHAAQKAEVENEAEITHVDLDDDKSNSVRSEETVKLDQPPTKKPKINEDEVLPHLSTARLKELCKSVGLPKSGSRSDLIARYEGPHPPKVWLSRKDRGQYVPNGHNVAGTALLVALYLHEKKTGGLDKGLVKDELYVLAEGLNIKKDPFSGGTTQTGAYPYDGWSSMGVLLKGDPALVIKGKNRFKLTRSCDLAGFCVAEAMHKWCHQHNNCPCGQQLYL